MGVIVKLEHCVRSIRRSGFGRCLNCFPSLLFDRNRLLYTQSLFVLTLLVHFISFPPSLLFIYLLGLCYKEVLLLLAPSGWERTGAISLLDEPCNVGIWD